MFLSNFIVNFTLFSLFFFFELRFNLLIPGDYIGSLSFDRLSHCILISYQSLHCTQLLASLCYFQLLHPHVIICHMSCLYISLAIHAISFFFMHMSKSRASAFFAFCKDNVGVQSMIKSVLVEYRIVLRNKEG